jgi:beta-xylosidase
MHVFTYTNPITRDPSQSMRDHQILKVGDTWYMTGSTPPYWTLPNPGVRLFTSRDLLHWTFHSWLIDASKLSDDCFYRGRFWAPEIHRAHNRFYLTVNTGNRGDRGEQYATPHAVVLFVADRVTGPYELLTKKGPIGKEFRNDASLFTDDDGRSYLYCSGGGLWQAEIDLKTGKLFGRDDAESICGPRDAGNPDWMHGGIEGPFVIKRVGVYYMFFSAWTRGYEVGVMRAAHPLGPWKLMPNSPILGTRKRHYREPQMIKGGYAHIQFEDTRDPFVETGHCAIFEGPDGKDWVCCHYLLEGKQIASSEPVIEYADTAPHLAIEPLDFRDGLFRVNGPTWTEQVVEW